MKASKFQGLRIQEFVNIVRWSAVLHSEDQVASETSADQSDASHGLNTKPKLKIRPA